MQAISGSFPMTFWCALGRRLVSLVSEWLSWSLTSQGLRKSKSTVARTMCSPFRCNLNCWQNDIDQSTSGLHWLQLEYGGIGHWGWPCKSHVSTKLLILVLPPFPEFDLLLCIVMPAVCAVSGCKQLAVGWPQSKCSVVCKRNTLECKNNKHCPNSSRESESKLFVSRGREPLASMPSSRSSKFTHPLGRTTHPSMQIRQSNKTTVEQRCMHKLTIRLHIRYGHKPQNLLDRSWTGHEVCGSPQWTNLARRNQTGAQSWARSWWIHQPRSKAKAEPLWPGLHQQHPTPLSTRPLCPSSSITPCCLAWMEIVIDSASGPEMSHLKSCPKISQRWCFC